ncbi:MAG: hypothetical protein ACRC2B_24975 [Rubrivivax sp.]
MIALHHYRGKTSFAPHVLLNDLAGSTNTLQATAGWELAVRQRVAG